MAVQYDVFDAVKFDSTASFGEYGINHKALTSEICSAE